MAIKRNSKVNRLCVKGRGLFKMHNKELGYIHHSLIVLSYFTKASCENFQAYNGKLIETVLNLNPMLS